MTETNIFAIAARKKFRFPSTRGELTVEQLFDLPLLATGSRTLGFDLNTVAKSINTELKAAAEESFVETSTNPAAGDLETKLEIVKFVIAEKKAAAEKAKARADKRQRRQLLLDAIAAAQARELGAASPADLQKQLDELEADED